MKNALARQICRVLIFCVAAVPFDACAGIVATDRVIAAAPAQAARDTLREFVRRGDMARELHRLGVSPGAALARVDAMTDAEVASVASRIDSMPAGGASVWAMLIALIVLELIIYFWVD